MYEFELKYTKIQHSGHFGHTCTSTALTCTGTSCILLGCTGTALYLYRYRLASAGVYRYNPVPIPVQPREFCPELLFLPTFGTNSLHTTSPFLNTSKIIMEFISNHSITLVLVVWNSYHKTLGENLMNSTKDPPILLKTI